MYTLIELSQEVGCHAETCNYYERLGILRPAIISNTHRLYDHEHKRQLQFILNLRNLGFNLEQTADLVNLLWTESIPLADVISSLDKHIISVNRKIHTLQKLQGSLMVMMKKYNEKQIVSPEVKSNFIDQITAHCPGDKH